MDLKNCILANFFRYVFQIKVSSDVSNLPSEPSLFFCFVLFLQLHLSLNLLSILVYQALQISSKRKLASECSLPLSVPACTKF